MDIYSKPGTKVKFLAANGYQSELEEAMKTFKKDQVLTVKLIEIGPWDSVVWFEEDEFGYNTVMFEELDGN